MATAKKLVRIKCSNDVELVNVDEAVAMEFPAFKKLIEKNGIDAVSAASPISLPDVSSKTLAKVIKYCKYHVENRKTKNATPKEEFNEFKAWDTDFMKDIDLINLIQAAEYLDIENLKYLACETVVANNIRGKTDEEIPTFNEYTSEEMAELRNIAREFEAIE